MVSACLKVQSIGYSVEGASMNGCVLHCGTNYYLSLMLFIKTWNCTPNNLKLVQTRKLFVCPSYLSQKAEVVYITEVHVLFHMVSRFVFCCLHNVYICTRISHPPVPKLWCKQVCGDDTKSGIVEEGQHQNVQKHGKGRRDAHHKYLRTITKGGWNWWPLLMCECWTKSPFKRLATG